MRYLLDTNVISELRKPAGDRGVKAWIAEQSATDCAISVITVIEIEVGIQRRARTDAQQAAGLTAWFERQVLTAFEGRILPIDVRAARRVAPLHVPDPAAQHDALIAGTALARSMTVVTRNIGGFERTGVPLINPWSNDGR